MTRLNSVQRTAASLDSVRRDLQRATTAIVSLQARTGAAAATGWADERELQAAVATLRTCVNSASAVLYEVCCDEARPLTVAGDEALRSALVELTHPLNAAETLVGRLDTAARRRTIDPDELRDGISRLAAQFDHAGRVIDLASAEAGRLEEDAGETEITVAGGDRQLAQDLCRLEAMGYGSVDGRRFVHTR